MPESDVFFKSARLLPGFRQPKRWAAVLLVVLASSLTACGQSAPGSSSSSMSAYDHMLRLLFKPTVPYIQPGELASLLQTKPEGVLLLDTRGAAEYRVSHLPGARFVEFNTFRETDLSAVPRTRPVVVYCSVGARSEQVGAWLREQGFRDVRNLYGGLFQWVNDGHEVVNAQGPTNQVHPYSVVWRPWLKRGVPTYE
ncbi:rhodanese-like domain-containing protein [Hymenobacter guriensis]|uniref:Rhodanese-like domain-containing protein n=1 Tax=Hymenobacter guriensis TaxID=2793065 RepID=A0ABS0L0V4_9BACT|nr:rhodanese-like domain-containing protein [Hymenobacter guriensis]MBG8553698.1 rhodanese-like domain-containing protein [Hymenobacter guriensis]